MKKQMIWFFTAILPLASFAQIDSSITNRPQIPKPPFPYKNHEVVYTNQTDTTVHLAGTLTVPDGKGPFPAVLLIGGSGQFPRDEVYQGHPLQWILADYLTRRGFATLRFDDRGAGESTSGITPAHQLTNTELMSDAKAGIEFLQSRSEIDKSRIGAMGGSAGASQAAALAVDVPGEIAFVVHIVGTTNLTPGEIVALQSKTVQRVKKLPAAVQEADSLFIKRSLWFTKNEADITKREAAIRKIAEEEAGRFPVPQRDSVLKGFQSRIYILSSEMFHQGANNPPKDILQDVRCPILVINGEKDVLVDGPYNAPRLEASLKAGGNKDYEVHLIKGMSHRMQLAKTGLMEESKDIEETVMPSVLKLIGDWLTKHTMRKG